VVHGFELGITLPEETRRLRQVNALGERRGVARADRKRPFKGGRE